MSDQIKCLNLNCSLTNDNDRMLSCWLCHGLCHFKCSGLRVLVAEAVTNTKGLHWCCNSCQKVGVEFYRFFQSTKNSFINIQNKLSLLSSEIAAYGNLFDDFKQLNNLESPVSSPKRRKSSRNKNKINVDASVIPNSIVNQPEIASTVTIDLINDKNPTNIGISTPVVDSNVPVTYSQAVQSSVSVRKDPMPSIFNSNTTTNINVNKVPYPTTSVLNNNNVSPKPLIVLPPKKYIFISRFAAETTAEDVDFYIKSKLGVNADILINKFSYSQPRSITSFKVAVPPDVYNIIIVPEFWPPNTIVREYLFKENPRINNIAQLPSRNVHFSKN